MICGSIFENPMQANYNLPLGALIKSFFDHQLNFAFIDISTILHLVRYYQLCCRFS